MKNYVNSFNHWKAINEQTDGVGLKLILSELKQKIIDSALDEDTIESIGYKILNKEVPLQRRILNNRNMPTPSDTESKKIMDIEQAIMKIDFAIEGNGDSNSVHWDEQPPSENTWNEMTPDERTEWKTTHRPADGKQIATQRKNDAHSQLQDKRKSLIDELENSQNSVPRGILIFQFKLVIGGGKMSERQAWYVDVLSVDGVYAIAFSRRHGQTHIIGKGGINVREGMIGIKHIHQTLEDAMDQVEETFLVITKSEGYHWYKNNFDDYEEKKRQKEERQKNQ